MLSPRALFRLAFLSFVLVGVAAASYGLRDRWTAQVGGGPAGGAACICGDYVIVRPEQCDNGVNNSDTVPNACRTDCKKARCGDNVVDTGETCDHGSSNGRPGDSCSSGCGTTIIEQCGNSKRELSEECDDGNTKKGDGCDDACKEEPGWECNPSGGGTGGTGGKGGTGGTGGGVGACPAAYPICTQDTGYGPQCPQGQTFAYPNPFVPCGSGEALGGCYSCT